MTKDRRRLLAWIQRRYGLDGSIWARRHPTMSSCWKPALRSFCTSSIRRPTRRPGLGAPFALVPCRTAAGSACSADSPRRPDFLLARRTAGVARPVTLGSPAEPADRRAGPRLSDAYTPSRSTLLYGRVITGSGNCRYLQCVISRPTSSPGCPLSPTPVTKSRQCLATRMAPAPRSSGPSPPPLVRSPSWSQPGWLAALTRRCGHPWPSDGSCARRPSRVTSRAVTPLPYHSTASRTDSPLSSVIVCRAAPSRRSVSGPRRYVHRVRSARRPPTPSRRSRSARSLRRTA